MTVITEDEKQTFLEFFLEDETNLAILSTATDVKIKNTIWQDAADDGYRTTEADIDNLFHSVMFRFSMKSFNAPIICDGCGERFSTTLDENDDPMDPNEEAEETGWAVNEGSAHCQNCQHLDPDQPGARIDLDEVEDWPYLESTRGGAKQCDQA